MTTLSSTMVSTFFLPRKLLASLGSLPNVGKARFGVKNTGRRGRITCMATHKVKLITPDGSVEFDCPNDTYILAQ